MLVVNLPIGPHCVVVVDEVRAGITGNGTVAIRGADCLSTIPSSILEIKDVVKSCLQFLPLAKIVDNKYSISYIIICWFPSGKPISAIS
jgi:hypothetical protein